VIPRLALSVAQSVQLQAKTPDPRLQTTSAHYITNSVQQPCSVLALEANVAIPHTFAKLLQVKAYGLANANRELIREVFLITSARNKTCESIAEICLYQ